MSGRVGPGWRAVRTNFGFVPALCAFGAVALFFATQQLDQVVLTDLDNVPIVFSGGATAARSVLSTIAGSLITVVTTAFSLTLVTLQLASTNYSPRVLRSFAADRGVQTVLGVYIATFLYALLVLRIVRDGEDGSASGAFIPVISTTVAVVLAVVCVGLLIYFIAHVVYLIQSSSIVYRAHEDTVRAMSALDDLLPEGRPEHEEPAPLRARPELRALLAGEPCVVRARRSGYVQRLDVEAVAGAVDDGGGKPVALELPSGPGRFVAAGLPLARVWPARGLRGPEAEGRVRDAVALGKERSFEEDFAFGLRQLSDIALKGLSPGVNDPTTAMQAMDRIEAILVALGGKALPERVREFDGGRVVVEADLYGFEDVAGLAFDQIRRAAFTSGQVAVLERLLEAIGRVLEANRLPERWRALWSRALSVASNAPGGVSDPEDAASLVRAAVVVGAVLRDTELDAPVREDVVRLLAAAEDRLGDRGFRALAEEWRGSDRDPAP